MESGEETSLEPEAVAAARRERLGALRAAQELLTTAEENSTNDNAKNLQVEHPKEDEDPEETPDDENRNINMRFRNYLPHDKQLQEGKLVPPALPKFEDPPQLAAPVIEEKKEDPFLRIAPKKPNWDLRRDVQKRLDKLERRTQKALLILMEREEAKRNSLEDAEN